MKIQKSGSRRKVLIRTPGGRQVAHYVQRKHKVLKCAKCGRPLLGVPRRESLSTKLSKSKRVPSRPYGGVLCAKCMREAIKSGEVVENV